MNKFPNDLLTGYSAFRDGSFAIEQQRYFDLAEHGQTPATLLIACCDSRVSPEVIFQTKPGELFVIRNVANLVPPHKPDNECHSTSAALEYAVSVLKVQHIVVMGHGGCGGIAAAIDAQLNGAIGGEFIDHWIELLKPSITSTLSHKNLEGAKLQSHAEKDSIIRSIENLRTFPIVTEAEKSSAITLHGAWFEVKSGELSILDRDSGKFIEP